jgi:3'-phosphoadenosine 5'-phosphosulfate sulfotransferase (PAPS reductase)/FAD synthetase
MPEPDELADAILEETEITLPAGPPAGPSSMGSAPGLEEMTASARKIANHAFSTSRRVCLAFSGGSDSLVLLDLIAQQGLQPVVVYAETGMEYPETRPFVERTIAHYGLDLRVARPPRQPLEQFQLTGWPMLGKIAARLWMQKNRGRGFRINVSECCRAMKIGPARTLARNLGCDTQLTGQRGKADDVLRGYRAIQDGSDHLQERDRIRIVNPLAGWTDAHTRQYLEDRHLEGHPARSRGATTIGCVFCGGGSQYTNSGFRALRSTWPEAWHRFMVEWQGGTIILALKYGKTAGEIQDATARLGGLAALADTRPWVFDFTRRTPMKGYSK